MGRPRGRTIVLGLIVGLVLLSALGGRDGGGPGATPTPAIAVATATPRSPDPTPVPTTAGPSGSATSGDATGGTLESPSPSPTGSPSPASVTASGARGTAAALLARLPLRAERGAGYARSLFRLWIDADRDGCDTRREVLIAESTTVVRVGASCWLSGGRWRSAYDGVVTTDPGTFDIDHVVPLKEAWDSGAWDWSAARRMAFANDLGDPRSLRAVTASSNRGKSDADPAGWLPMASFRCTYAEEWIAIKVRWKLAVDATERSALASILVACPARTITVAIISGGEHGGSTAGGSAGSGGTVGGIAPSGCNPNYAGWCVPNSTTDLDCPDIGHRVTVIGVDVYRLDSDGDGTGCDSYPPG